MANVKVSSYIAATIISATVSVSTVSASYDYKREAISIAARASSISFTTELVPMRAMAPETITVTDSTPVLTVDRVSGDTVTVSESPVMSVDIVKTDSVTMQDVPNKIINSSIDFDLSDPDVDPDPINMSDTQAFDLSKAVAEINEVTIGDLPSKQPNKFPTDSVTMAQSFGPFNIGKNPSDSVAVSEDDAKTLTRPNITDSASIGDSPAKNITPAGKTDSISVGDTPVKNITPAGKTDSVTIADSFGPFTIGVNPTDTVNATESIATQLILGESSYLYPTRFSVFDGAETGQVKGFHIGNSDIASRVADTQYLMNNEFGILNDHYIGGENRDGIRFYNRVFEQDQFRLRNIDYSAQIANGDSLLNSAVMWDSATDGAGIKEFTGVIGSAGLIGQPIVNSDTITYGELVNAGLLVNFIYTDTSDSPTTGSHAVNGHFLNETPMGAGSH